MLRQRDRMAGRVWRDLADNRDGATAVVTGLVFMSVVGFAGLGTEAGLWYFTERSLQAAADSSALSAASSLLVNSNNYTTEARATAARYGFVDGSGGTQVTVNRPPASGRFAGNANAVEVIVQQPQTAILSAAFLPGGQAPTLSGRAVALQGNPGTGCVLALDSGAAAATFGNGTTNVSLVKCGLYVNSNSNSALTLTGGATLTVDTANIVGNYSDSANTQFTAVNGINTKVSPATDPYSSASVPPFTGCDHTKFSAPKTGTVSPGVFCNGFKVDGQSSISLSPGTYIINGGSLSIAGGATVTGNGVTFVMTNTTGSNPATVSINGGANLTISAPTSGALAGLAFFQDRTGTAGTNNDFAGGTTQSITGAIYFPTETVNFAGGTQTGTGCMQLIADEVDFKGNAVFEINCSGKGTRSIGASSARLVE